MADLQPKRGFVERKAWPGFDNCFEERPQVFQVGGIDRVPVLVIPEPDRAPTEAKVVALGEALFATTAPGAIDGPFAAMFREVARAAWRLGARVQA